MSPPAGRPPTQPKEPGEAALREHLQRQRWFGEKGRELESVALADVIPVTWPETQARFAVARARVRMAGRDDAWYQLFLRDGGRALDDALEDASFRHGLVNAFAAGATFASGGTRWVIQSESDAPFKVPADAAIAVSRAEQSNTSLVIGTQAMLKLFRRLQPGLHPDVEVTRFLTVERRFVHTPVLLGSITFIDAQGAWVAGMLQDQVPGATDAWSHALACSRDWFAGTGNRDALPFTAEAGRLGSITRELHETLASGDPGSPFAPVAAGASDLARWTASTRGMMQRSLESLERSQVRSGLPGRRAALAEWIGDLARQVGNDAGARIRIHGDYHLGQVLRSVTGAFLIVDFEGEPARALEERRMTQSPLRDVAGMLRSFAYLAAVAAQHAGGDDRQSRADEWERALREAFLGGYFAGSREPKAILPSSRARADSLIGLFEAEKMFYELQYELDHRPDWAWIPLRAIERVRA